MIHKEGINTIIIGFISLAILCILFYFYVPGVFPFALIAAIVLFGLIVQFFRNPKRLPPDLDENLIYAPADGKVVVIEETEETEYYHDKRIQVSIFMSPLNVHVNRFPFSGVVEYFKYHPGKYLTAWHPKSSTENERTTVVIQGENGSTLLRQIAGAVARRICYYVQEGSQLKQGDEFGFIKFGSRVDLFLPLDSKIQVKLDEKVKGNKTVIAHFN